MDCMAFLEEGWGRLEMAWVLSGLIIIQYLETLNPRNFPCSTAKTDFLGLSEIPNLRHHSNTTLRCDR
jgi:hypothetical protein